MRIRDVEVIGFTFRSALVRDEEGHTHPGPEHEATMSLTRILADEGAEGLCLGGSPAMLAVAREALVGENPFYRERIWQRLHKFQRLYGTALCDGNISVLDQALWDLAGKHCGLPVYQLMGAYRDTVPAYASTMCGDDLADGLGSPEAYADFAAACVAQGYKAVKLHTWMPPFGRDPRHDVAACAAVRGRVGPEIELMLDCNHDYSRQEALYIGRGLEELGFRWFEEPMNEASMSSYVWLCQQLDITVVGPETAGGMFHTRAEWIVHHASDISRYKEGLGGLTAMRKCVHLCEAHGVGLEVHGGGHGNLHALGAMGIPGEYYERGLLHPHYDYDSAQPWLLHREDEIDSEGNVHLPQTPGLGLDLDWDYIRQHRV